MVNFPARRQGAICQLVLLQYGPELVAGAIVTVEPGLSAKGLVAVTPVGGDLGPGDLVVVGDNNAGSPSANGGKGKQTKGAGSAKKKP